MTEFEACTLPREAWTHRAHLTVGLWYVSHYPLAEATALIRGGIQRYNEACGVVTTATSGYHETITLFFVKFIHRFLESADRQTPLVELVAQFFELHGDRGLPLQFYSKERLMSWEARTGWIEPDLKQISERDGEQTLAC